MDLNALYVFFQLQDILHIGGQRSRPDPVKWPLALYLFHEIDNSQIRRLQRVSASGPHVMKERSRRIVSVKAKNLHLPENAFRLVVAVEEGEVVFYQLSFWR